MVHADAKGTLFHFSPFHLIFFLLSGYPQHAFRRVVALAAEKKV